MPGHVVQVDAGVVVEEAPVDDGAEGGGVAVDVGRGPEDSVWEGQAGLTAGVAGHDGPVLQSPPLLPPAESDQDGLQRVVSDGQEAGPVGEVEEVLPPVWEPQSPAERVEEEEEDCGGEEPSVEQVGDPHNTVTANPLKIKTGEEDLARTGLTVLVKRPRSGWW